MTPADPSPVVLAAPAPDSARVCDPRCLLRAEEVSVLLTETWWVSDPSADQQEEGVPLCRGRPHQVHCPTCDARRGVVLRLLPGAQEVTARCPAGHSYQTDVPVTAFLRMAPSPEPLDPC
ncbi:hypothetical protein [Actinomadura opuntiae]|uniref:hypothetical protein n=1 Tax=Actinomadura sp. OS1-43 TaxID=604315 RepID=UPI00255AF126|nr:hypothetical protein [Actinomadura sp. OS1-43]MDL4813115.1 hypothetical protein [Actinomadura sp. OS1-43]